MDEYGRLVLYKKDLIDDFEDLIKRALINEGFSEADFAEKIPYLRFSYTHSALIKLAADTSTISPQTSNTISCVAARSGSLPRPADPEGGTVP